MASWEVNKGVGRTTEFKELKAHYFFLFAGGLLDIFIFVMILYLCGISQIICLGIGVVGATVIVWQTFAMNHKYGQYGLMKRGATRRRPGYLLNRHSVYQLFHQLNSAR